MGLNPPEHHRRSIRLKGYDYSQTGAYFVTICTQGRKHLLGHMSGEEMVLSDCGRVVERRWRDLSGHFLDIEWDEFVLMPNHLHGIIIINRVDGFNVGAKHLVGKATGRANASLRPYKHHTVRNRVPWEPSSRISNRFRRVKSIKCTEPLAFHDGNATITNILSGTKNH